jgi:hypothetical protein
MKKRFGIHRAVPIIAPSEIKKLPTKVLLARLARLRFCEESHASSDLTEDEVRSVNGILFKETAEWSAAVAQLKEELSRREHVPRPMLSIRCGTSKSS